MPTAICSCQRGLFSKSLYLFLYGYWVSLLSLTRIDLRKICSGLPPAKIFINLFLLLTTNLISELRERFFDENEIPKKVKRMRSFFGMYSISSSSPLPQR